MIRPEVIDALAAAGCTPEQIAAAYRADHAAEERKKEARRAGNAERQRRFREAHSNANNALHAVTARDTPPPFVPPDKEAPEPQEITPPISPRPAERERGANPSVILQSEVDAMTAQAFSAHCSEKRRPLSSQQAGEIVGVLRGVRAAGGNPADALRFAIKRGWVSLEINYLRNNGFPFKSAAPPDPIDWAGRLRVFGEDGTWVGTWGPKPGEKGCQVPSELLVKAA